MFTYANARIKVDGLWSGNDWYNNDAHMGVKNGIPYSEDDAMSRKLDAAMALEGGVPDYLDFNNVQRVKNIINEEEFEEIFPMRNELYTYDGLLRAIGKFPAFCGESNMFGNDLNKTCKRELAMLFAHFGQETGYHDPHNIIPEWKQGLWHITEWACTEPQQGRGTPRCDYKKDWDWAGEEYPV